MYKIAVMGDRDSISGFASIGVSIFPTDGDASPTATLHRLAQNNYAVIFITEALAVGLEHEIDQYRSKRIPAIILIPGISGNTGMGLANVSKSVEQAVGSDIFSQD